MYGHQQLKGSHYVTKTSIECNNHSPFQFSVSAKISPVSGLLQHNPIRSYDSFVARIVKTQAITLSQQAAQNHEQTIPCQWDWKNYETPSWNQGVRVTPYWNSIKRRQFCDYFKGIHSVCLFAAISWKFHNIELKLLSSPTLRMHIYWAIWLALHHTMQHGSWMRPMWLACAPNIWVSIILFVAMSPWGKTTYVAEFICKQCTISPYWKSKTIFIHSGPKMIPFYAYKGKMFFVPIERNLS